MIVHHRQINDPRVESDASFGEKPLRLPDVSGLQRQGEFFSFIRRLPPLLKARLIELAARPHTFEPITAFSEAAEPSQLFQYYLLDTNKFQPNVFTSVIPGINDTAIPTAANAANGGLPTLGAVRVKAFRPDVTDAGMRLFLAYAQEIGRVDQNGDGVISFQEADINGFSDGGQSNRRLYLRPSDFNRFAVTREINDGLLAPRFAPFQRAYVLSGTLTLVNPSVPASAPRDADDR